MSTGWARSFTNFFKEVQSAANFHHQTEAYFSDMFSYFYLAKNTKLLITEQILKLVKKISADLESSDFKKKFNVGFS